MIKVTFFCDGCSASTEATRSPKREFVSMNGKGYGFGQYKIDSIEDVVPDGWVAFDPYTGACYCPTCWDTI